ncbi:MAG: hypothetical protein ACI8UX_002214 [Psychromonas sp.]|jgi:hypothetical protein
MNKFFLLLLVITSCQSKDQHYVDRAVLAHGGESYASLHAAFTFRGLDYDLQRNHDNIVYKRTQKDSLGNVITDVLTNNGFKRLINNEMTVVPDSIAHKYENSINSVAYFFLLPNGLNDDAVNKAYEKEIDIKGQKYHQIKVWFDQEGGGEDHQDIYKFWLNDSTQRLDYLAYSYETDGGGVRLRKAYNGQKIGNFYFQDYNNYGIEDGSYPLDSLIVRFEEGTLPFLSKIENENIHLIP